jgi:hypothetical protein
MRGRIMSDISGPDLDEGFDKEARRRLLQRYIDEDAIGAGLVRTVVKLILTRGEDILDRDQSLLWREHILPGYVNVKCMYCSTEIPYDDVDVHGRSSRQACSGCNHFLDKAD